MRTALSTVEQTLAPEAATILGQAVSDARRRGHAQTTPLHMAAALLSSPLSKLRQACIRSHQGSATHPLQCRALELLFDVALKRLPKGQSSSTVAAAEEPVLSNALVAVIKRAQAHQRRACPEQQQQPLLAVKVELDYFLLSILDDPSVSRVMSEAKFSSTSVKAHLLVIGFGLAFNPNSNASLQASTPGFLHRTLLAPSLSTGGASAIGPETRRSDDARRVADVLVRSKRRNPVLVGDKVACEAVITELAEKIDKGAPLPQQLRGLQFVRAELDRDDVDAALRELKGRVEDASGDKGVVVNLGELKWLLDDAADSSNKRVVVELGELLATNAAASSSSKGVWLMGTASIEMYMECQARHPLIESSWDLQPVPIAASRPAAGLLPRFGGQENMCSSFKLHIPSGSFPGTTLTPRKPIEGSTRCHKISCCYECMVKYKQELIDIEKEEKVAVSPDSLHIKPSDQEQKLLPQWLLSEMSIHRGKGPDILQANDQEITWNHKVEELQNKWNERCQSLHPHFHGLSQNVHGKESQISTCLSSDVLSTNKKSQKENIESQLRVQYHPSGEKNCMSSDSHWPWLSWSSVPTFPETCTRVQIEHTATDLKISDKHKQIQQDQLISFSKHLETCTSPVSSVRTDLALGRNRILPSSSGIKTVREHKQIFEIHQERLKDLTGCMSSNMGLPSKNPDVSISYTNPVPVNSQRDFLWKLSPEVSMSRMDEGPQGFEQKLLNRQHVKSSSPFQEMDVEAFKRLSQGLKERVSWQHEAVASVAHTVTQCRSGNGKYRGVSQRGDIWLLLLGPDQVGKRNVASGLAEIIFKGDKKFICLGLSCQECRTSLSGNSGKQSLLGYGAKFRGKTILDQVVEEVKQRPFCVMLLEDVDKADLVVQSSLIQAADKGRLSDSHGREVGIGNIIFVLTAISGIKSIHHIQKKETFFPEEKLVEAQGWQMQILVESARFEVLISKRKRVSVINYENGKETEELQKVGLLFGSANKRKFDDLKAPDVKLPKIHKASAVSLDLNLTVEEIEAADDSTSFNGQAEASQGLFPDLSDLTVEQIEWKSRYFKEIYHLIDNTVTFMPFNFDDLAERVVGTISGKLFSIIGSEGLLEIDIKVMEQILATVWFSFDGMKSFEEWAEEVLGKCFQDVGANYTISADTVVKLVTVKESFLGGRGPGVFLPKNIFLNKDADATRERAGKHT